MDGSPRVLSGKPFVACAAVLALALFGLALAYLRATPKHAGSGEPMPPEDQQTPRSSSTGILPGQGSTVRIPVSSAPGNPNGPSRAGLEIEPSSLGEVIPDEMRALEMLRGIARRDGAVEALRVARNWIESSRETVQELVRALGAVRFLPELGTQHAPLLSGIIEMLMAIAEDPDQPDCVRAEAVVSLAHGTVSCKEASRNLDFDHGLERSLRRSVNPFPADGPTYTSWCECGEAGAHEEESGSMEAFRQAVQAHPKWVSWLGSLLATNVPRAVGRTACGALATATSTDQCAAAWDLISNVLEDQQRDRRNASWEAAKLGFARDFAPARAFLLEGLTSDPRAEVREAFLGATCGWRGPDSTSTWKVPLLRGTIASLQFAGSLAGTEDEAAWRILELSLVSLAGASWKDPRSEEGQALRELATSIASLAARLPLPNERDMWWTGEIARCLIYTPDGPAEAIAILRSDPTSLTGQIIADDLEERCVGRLADPW